MHPEETASAGIRPGNESRKRKGATVNYSAQTKVGFFFIVGIATLLIVYEMLGGFAFLTPGSTYTTAFDSAHGLRIGDPVRLSGLGVGSVTGLDVVDDKIEVALRIDGGTPVRSDSVAIIKLTSLLGTSFVDISFGSSAAPLLPPGSRITSEEGADLNVLVEQAQELATSLNTNQQRFFTRLDSLMGDDDNGLTMTLSNLNGLLTDIRSGKGTLGRLATDDSLYVELQGTFKRLNTVSQKILDGEGTLGKLVSDDTLYLRFTDTMDGLAEITRQVRSGEGTLGKLFTDDTLYVQTTELTTTLNSLLKKVEQGEGTLGKLVMDDALYNTATDAMYKLGKTADTAEDLAPLTPILSLGSLLF